MDIWVIFLIVLILIILYTLYAVTVSAALTQPMAPLATTVVIPATDANGKVKIKTPTVKQYYYEGWFYVMSAPSQVAVVNDAATSNNVSLSSSLFSRIAATGNDVGLGLYQNSTTKNYTLVLYSGNTAKYKGNIITEEFPLNKWVYIVVAVSGQLVEIYLNGKMLKTIYLATSVSPGPTAPITLGSTKYTGYSTRFNRIADSIQPDKVWQKYLNGNGQYAGILFGLLDYINGYAFNLNITKNGDVKQKLSLGGTGTSTS